MDDDEFDLITLRVQLQQKYGRKGPSYDQLWRGAVNGRFPAHRIRRHWYVRVNIPDPPVMGVASTPRTMWRTSWFMGRMLAAASPP